MTVGGLSLIMWVQYFLRFYKIACKGETIEVITTLDTVFRERMVDWFGEVCTQVPRSAHR